MLTSPVCTPTVPLQLATEIETQMIRGAESFRTPTSVTCLTLQSGHTILHQRVISKGTVGTWTNTLLHAAAPVTLAGLLLTLRLQGHHGLTSDVCLTDLLDLYIP